MLVSFHIFIVVVIVISEAVIVTDPAGGGNRGFLSITATITITIVF